MVDVSGTDIKPVTHTLPIGAGKRKERGDRCYSCGKRKANAKWGFTPVCNVCHGVLDDTDTNPQYKVKK